MGNDLGEFLRSRRARIDPGQVGLTPGLGQRRVPGLRREELAQLAGVSVDYYVHLEQGRSPHVSDSVLDAISRVLELSEVEREHLGNIARPRTRRPRPQPQPVSPQVRRLLDLMPSVPALVLGRRMEILAWNEAADAVFDVRAMTSARRSAARHVFLDPGARTLYLNWDAVAADVVCQLRLEAGRYSDDPLLASLIGELSMNSDVFRRLWAKADVKQKAAGVTQVAHPLAGELEFAYEVLQLPAQPGQFITTYTYPPASATDERLQLLLSLSITPRDSETAREDKSR